MRVWIIVGLFFFVPVTVFSYMREGTLNRTVTVYENEGWDYTNYENAVKAKRKDLPKKWGWIAKNQRVILLSPTGLVTLDNGTQKKYYRVEIAVINDKGEEEYKLGFIEADAVDVDEVDPGPMTDEEVVSTPPSLSEEPAPPVTEVAPLAEEVVTTPPPQIVMDSKDTRLPEPDPTEGAIEDEVSPYMCVDQPVWVEKPSAPQCWEGNLAEFSDIKNALSALCDTIKCNESSSSTEEGFRQELLKSTFTDIQCINWSMMKGRKLKPHKRKACDSTNDRKGRVTERPCITKELVQYTQLTFEQALKCINSDGRYPVESQEFFALTHLESEHQFNMEYDGGKGITQMTTLGARSMGLDDSGNPGIALRAWRRVKENSSCEMFRGLIDESGPLLKGNNEVNECLFLDVEEGFLRAYIMGMALYKGYQVEVSEWIGDDFLGANTAEEERARAITYATQIAYNRGYTRWRKQHDKLMKTPPRPATADEYKNRLEAIVWGDNDSPYATNIEVKYFALNKDMIYGKKYGQWKGKIHAKGKNIRAKINAEIRRNGSTTKAKNTDYIKGWFRNMVEEKNYSYYSNFLGIPQDQLRELAQEFKQMEALNDQYNRAKGKVDRLPAHLRPC